MKRFGLPPQLADYYVRWQEFFDLLRYLRDNVVHRGSRIQTFFSNEQGFLIVKALRPFNDMNVWKSSERLPNDVVPLMPALGVVAYQTLSALEDFSQTISSVIGFPLPLVPGMRLYMRGHFNKSFAPILLDARERLIAAENKGGWASRNLTSD